MPTAICESLQRAIIFEYKQFGQTYVLGDRVTKIIENIGISVDAWNIPQDSAEVIDGKFQDKADAYTQEQINASTSWNREPWMALCSISVQGIRLEEVKT
jgi:hypothetical protein